MATQKLAENVQQHDEVVESSKTGCRSQSRAHGKAYGQVPARHLCPRPLPKYLGNKSEIPHLNFTPPHNCGLQLQVTFIVLGFGFWVEGL